MKCPYCGSEHIELGIAWGKSAEAGNVGLRYDTGKGGFFSLSGVVTGLFRSMSRLQKHLEIIYQRRYRQKLES